MRIRPLTIWRLCVLAIGVPLACLFLYFSTLHHNPYFDEVFRLRVFGQALLSCSRQNGQLPGPSLRDAVRSLQQSDEWESWRDSIDQRTLEGRDGWGRSLYYQRLGDMEAIIRSYGANGRDDNGDDDDIEVRITEFGLTSRIPKELLPHEGIAN